MALAEYFNGSSWITLSSLTNITLTGAVTGSGGSIIATTLNTTQTIASSLFSINWTNATASSKIINHYLLDSSPLASSIPQFVNTVQVGTGGSGGSSTQRSWSLYYIPGYASTPVGANFTISYYHNTGFERFPLTINCTGIGDFDFSTTLYGKLIVNGTLDLGLNKLINVATPTALTDGANRDYVDKLIGNLNINTDSITSTTNQIRVLKEIYMTDNGLWLRPSTSKNYGMIYNSTIDGTQFRGFAGFSWGIGSLGATEAMCLLSDGTLQVNKIQPLSGTSITSTVSTSVFNLIVNNTNLTATDTSLILRKNGVFGAIFGFNSNTNEANISISSSSTLKFVIGTSTVAKFLNTGDLDLQDNNLTTTGNLSITGTTGFLTARKIRGSSTNASITSSSDIILSAGCILTVLSGTGILPTFNYGYLNPSGSTGTATSTISISYSIDAGSRIVASEFNARSSKNIKDIHSRDEAIEDEVLDIFKKISFTKYSYKDPYTNGFGNYYGVIAEELREVLPNYVVDNKNYLPNILCFFDIKKAKEGYYLNNNNFDLNALYSDISSVKLQLVGQKNIHIDARIEDNSFFILKKNIDELDLDLFELKNIFVFGTYGDCPTVCKTRLSDFSMVALKNVIKRLETLESKI